MTKILGPRPANRAELDVYLQLKRDLPTDWVVIASVAWSQVEIGENSEYVRDGQSDFVVLAPHLGMAILEVKGSRQFRVGHDGLWYRTDHRGREVIVSPSPMDQATDNMHKLEKLVRRKLGLRQFPGLFAYLVVYPHGIHAGEPSPLYHESTVVDANKMDQLKSRITSALLARGSQSQGTGFSEQVVETIADVLANRRYTISKADALPDVTSDSAAIEMLTRQQFATLQGLFRLPRVAVTGPAGSGKTVLAIWRLAAFVEEGKRALYVCYNTMLAESLRRRNPGLAANIVTIDRFLLSLAGRQGQDALPREASQKTVFFRETLPALAIDVASSFSPAEKYDALIVDEGQDFSELQLVALLEVLTPSDSSYVFFADWEQDVYSAASLGAIGVDVLFTLQHNCRNTVCINDTSNRLTARRVPSMPGVPAGTKPLVLRRSGAGAVATEAWVTARSWYNGPGSVAILSPFKLENSSMAASLKGHGLSLVTSLDEWDTPDTVYFSTIKSFKGIEAPTVIVVDVNLPDASPSFRREDAYVACTRATTRLALITSNDVAAKWMEQELSDGAPALSVPPRRV